MIRRWSRVHALVSRFGCFAELSGRISILYEGIYQAHFYDDRRLCMSLVLLGRPYGQGELIICYAMVMRT